MSTYEISTREPRPRVEGYTEDLGMALEHALRLAPLSASPVAIASTGGWVIKVSIPVPA